MADATLDTQAKLAELEIKAAKAIENNDHETFAKTRQEIRNILSGKTPSAIPMEQRPIDESDPFLNVPRFSPDSLQAAVDRDREGHVYNPRNPDYELIDWAGMLPEGVSDRLGVLKQMWDDPEFARSQLGAGKDALLGTFMDPTVDGSLDPTSALAGSEASLSALDALTTVQPETWDAAEDWNDDTYGGLPQDTGTPLEITEDLLPPTEVDGYGVENTPEVPEQTLTEITEADSTRAPSRWNPDAEHNVGSITPVDEDGKFLGGTRAKIGSFFGHDSEEELERFGSALLGFGSGLLSGGPDIGAALGHGFAKAGDQFVKTKKGQRQAALDDLKIAREDEKLNWEREKMDDWRRKTALARLGEDDPALTKLKNEVELKKQGYDKNEDGDWVYTGGSGMPDEYREYRNTVDAVMANNPGMPRGEAETVAKEILGIKKYDTNALNFGQ